MNEPQDTRMLPLPEDILLDIFSHLAIQDVLILRNVNKAFNTLTRTRTVWHHLLYTHVLFKGIPLPSRTLAALLPAPSSDSDLSSLSCGALEQLTLSALRLHRMWRSSQPPFSRVRAWSPLAKRASERPRCIGLHFLPPTTWCATRRLLTATMLFEPLGPIPRRVALQCWDLDVATTKDAPPTCIASRELRAPISWAVNPHGDSEGVIAVQSEDTEILAISANESNPSLGFSPLVTFAGDRRDILALSDGTIAVTIKHGDGTVWLSDWQNTCDAGQDKMQIGLRNPDLKEPERCQAIIVGYEYALVARNTTVEVYSLTSFREQSNKTAGDQSRILHPIQLFAWKWHIDHISMMPLSHVHPFLSRRPLNSSTSSWNTQSQPRRPSLVNILLRFGGFYPWPINILHHFILIPSPSYDPSLQPSPLNPPYDSTKDLHDAFPAPRAECALASPIGLFSPGADAFALGAHGGAAWADNLVDGADAHLGSGAAEGQRVAGCVLPRPCLEPAGPQDQSGPGVVVFAASSQDNWVRVALDEEAGRVAIGCADGRVQIREYG